jgi:hypothetical protein
VTAGARRSGAGGPKLGGVTRPAPHRDPGAPLAALSRLAVAGSVTLTLLGGGLALAAPAQVTATSVVVAVSDPPASEPPAPTEPPATTPPPIVPTVLPTSAPPEPTAEPTVEPTATAQPTASATQSPTPRPIRSSLRPFSPRPEPPPEPVLNSTAAPVTGAIGVGGITGSLSPDDSPRPGKTLAQRGESTDDNLSLLIVLILGAAVLLGASGATGLYLTRHHKHV